MLSLRVMAVVGCGQGHERQHGFVEQPGCEGCAGRGDLYGLDVFSAFVPWRLPHHPRAQDRPERKTHLGGQRHRAGHGCLGPVPVSLAGLFAWRAGRVLHSSVALITKRRILRFMLRRMRARDYNLKHMLVVGGGKLAQRYMDGVAAEPSLGIHVEQRMAFTNYGL